MKRILLIFLSCCALSVSALAAEADNIPPRWAFATDEEWRAASADQGAASKPTVPPEPSKPIESEGENDAALSPPSMDNDSDQKYPVGSYVDAAGHVWSPSGVLLSPDTVSSSEPVAEDTLSPSLPDNPNPSAALSVENPDELAEISSLLSDIAEDEPVWYVEDLRPTDAPAEVLVGLKALVASIFGEYTPVTTTSVVTETVGNEIRQYLVETVATGAAGVDYEWLAGVLLFAILLFCLMKLLGGVIS